RVRWNGEGFRDRPSPRPTYARSRNGDFGRTPVSAFCSNLPRRVEKLDAVPCFPDFRHKRRGLAWKQFILAIDRFAFFDARRASLVRLWHGGNHGLVARVRSNIFFCFHAGLG